MVVQIELPELEAPTKILFGGGHRFSHEAFWTFCVANPHLRTELNANGEIVIVPPAGFESSYQSLDVARQLGNWARTDKRGKASDSSGGFTLPSGAVYAPDAAWVSNARLQNFTRAQRQKFVALAPDFVVEVMSPSDRLASVKAKMQEWIDGGTTLAWLIDARRRRVIVYRPGMAPETLDGRNVLAGEGPVAGFILELGGIWEGT